MKLYKEVDGEMVEVTAEEMAFLKEPIEEDTREKTEEDAVSKLNENLTTLLTKFTERTSGLEKTIEEQDKRIADLSKSAQQRFPMGGAIEVNGEQEIKSFINEHFDYDRQGKWLTQTSATRTHTIDEKSDTLDEFKKYFALGAIASKGMSRDPLGTMKALTIMKDIYKTAVGDAGNVFPVPDIVDTEILAFAREQSVILQFGRVWDMTSEKQSFPAESAAASVGWGNTTAAGDPTIAEMELDAEELSSYSTVKNATLMDARSDVVSWLAESMAEAAGQELDNKAFNGAGTDDPFICSGIMSAACGYSVVMSSGNTSFADLSTTDLSNMIAALDGLKKQGARFLMNGAVLHYIRDLKDSNGRPIFYPGAVGGGTPAEIEGYPYTEVIKMTSTDGTSTPFIAFGNLRYFAVGRRLGATGLEVDPYGLFTTNRTRYKLYQRWALNMGLAAGFVRLITAAT